MKVKNYIIENRDLFFECLERELCQNGISYVRIKNEIHFQDQIIRLYDFELDKDSIIVCAFNKMKEQLNINNMLIRITEINPFENNLNYYRNFKNNNNDYINEKNYQKINKRVQKRQSNQVKQKLKMYKK